MQRLTRAGNLTVKTVTRFAINPTKTSAIFSCSCCRRYADNEEGRGYANSIACIDYILSILWDYGIRLPKRYG